MKVNQRNKSDSIDEIEKRIICILINNKFIEMNINSSH